VYFALALVLKLKSLALALNVKSLALALKLKSLALALALALQQGLVIILECNFFFAGNLCLFTLHSFRDYLLKPTSSNSVARVV